jgi:CRP/FNR family cyclic AMP-dependent transcriptional regulator
VTVVRRVSSGVCHVLREDSDLAEAIPAARRERVMRECTARELGIQPGRWTGFDGAVSEGIGLLLLKGLLVRKVGVDGRFGAELLGEGDLLRPWQEETEPLTLRSSTQWAVIQPVRLAVLDDRFARLIGRYPDLAGRLIGRAVERSRHLAVNMAIVHHARVDVRLHMLFWHLAARWGRVRGDGVTVPLRLTHSVLADLVAARRPTVTTALSELGRLGLVRSVDDGWLLAGDPPGQGVTFAPSGLSPIS